MATFTRFEEITAWQEARELSKLVYDLLKKPEFKHEYGLKDQMKNSSGSVMDNIAEGYERNGNKEFINFLYISKGSCGELRSQAYRASDQELLNQEEFDKIFQKCLGVSRLISSLIEYLEKSEFKGIKYSHRQNPPANL